MSINFKALSRYSTQLIGPTDKKLVLEVLETDYLSRGPKIKEFEDSLGAFCLNRHAIATNSATSALQIAYQVNNISNKSLVWTSPISFVATTNTALTFGARIDFIDIDPSTLNLSPDLLEKKLIDNKNQRPDFVSVVHFGGSPADLKKIFQLSNKFNFKIIEDASHALGAVFQGEPIGSNRYSDAVVFSFHPVKMITTGEGGALLVSSDEIKKKAEALRSHGIDISKTENKDYPDWYYEQHYLGYNFRLSEIQAALGISQLKQLKKFVKARNNLAKYYLKHLKDLPLVFQEILPNCNSSYHLFTIEITDARFSRQALFDYLKSHGIGCQVHYIPIHLQPFYKGKGFSEGMFPNAERYFQRCVSLPLHPGLRYEDLEFVILKLKDFFHNHALPSSASNSASL